MKFFFPAIAAALLCCLSCVEIDSGLGGSLIPVDQTYTIHPKETLLPYGSIRMELTDSLSGYSQTRITVGALRDEEFGLTTRSCVMTLVPVRDTMDFRRPRPAFPLRRGVRHHLGGHFRPAAHPAERTRSRAG